MNAELKEKIRAARAAVNAAVNPHGYTANRCMDEELAEEVGEAWFILESTRPTDKPHKDFFEACYYLHDFATNAKRKGTIVYGVQGNADWGDLPADPAAACAAFREENNNRPLTFEDARQMARKALVGTDYEDADIEEWGGGDGEEDIKPFRIDTANGTDLGMTFFPEGGVEFWAWPKDDDMKVFDSAAEAIAEFRRLIAA